MQRFYRFVTWHASFRYSIASRTRLILTGFGSLMSSLESLWVEWHGAVLPRRALMNICGDAERPVR